jgi:hypothetical protein
MAGHELDAALPSVAAVVSYLDHSAGWMRLPMWSRDGHEVDVPEDASAGRVALVLDWIAEAEGRGAADVAASVRALTEARTETAEARLAEVRETVSNFLAHYGHNPAASFKVAADLAHGVLQVLDRSEEGARDDR